MEKLSPLFEKNKLWANDIKKKDPDFFKNLSTQQTPKYLWIGCSDSRVPESEILGMLPGELFVHRNIANLVIQTDLSCLSVIQYAIEVLKIDHVIVSGHYGCGGVKAAMGSQEHGLIDNWLRHIKEIYRYHAKDIDLIKDEDERWDKMCELNVIEQVANVCHTTVVQKAWDAGRKLSVHGLIYDIRDGILKDLGICIESPKEVSRIDRKK